MPDQHAALAAREIPKQNSVVLAARGDEGMRTEGNREDDIAVALQATLEGSVTRIPDVYVLIAATRCQQCAIGAECKAGDGIGGAAGAGTAA